MPVGDPYLNRLSEAVGYASEIIGISQDTAKPTRELVEQPRSSSSYKDRIFNTATITTARKYNQEAMPRAIPVLPINFVDGSDEQFTREDVPKVWRLLIAAANTPTQD